MNNLVSVDWLKQNLENKDLILLDVSLNATVDGKKGVSQLETIPKARFFDLKGKFSDKNSPFPNTFPSVKQFEVESRKLGINSTSKIVVFDNLGIYSSPRVWWMFKVMGHNAVSVLNGGIPEWINKGFLTVSLKKETFKTGDFTANFNSDFVKNYDDIKSNLSKKSFTVMDARSKGRFNGTEKEPRKHLKSGHIPNSINIPYTEVLHKGKFKTIQELKSLFDAKDCIKENVVFSCGSGLTACVVLFANELVTKNKNFIYDGSWSEWAELQNLKT